MSVVQPELQGRGGAILGHVVGAASASEFLRSLSDSASNPSAEAREHAELVPKARRKGARWESALPVIDPHQPGQRNGGEAPR